MFREKKKKNLFHAIIVVWMQVWFTHIAEPEWSGMPYVWCVLLGKAGSCSLWGNRRCSGQAAQRRCRCGRGSQTSPAFAHRHLGERKRLMLKEVSCLVNVMWEPPGDQTLAVQRSRRTDLLSPFTVERLELFKHLYLRQSCLSVAVYVFNDLQSHSSSVTGSRQV